MYSYDFILIPVQLSQYVMRSRIVGPFRSYMTIKLVAGDRFKTTDSTLESVFDLLPVKVEKTLKAHLNKLMDLNWIGYNKGTYYIRSIDTLMSMNGLTASTSSIYFPAYADTFREFLFASVIGAAMVYTKNIGLDSVRLTGGASFASGTFQESRSFTYLGISATKIADKLKYDKAMACRDLRKAVEAGYLDKIRRYDWHYNKLDFSKRSEAQRYVAYLLEEGVKGIYVISHKSYGYRVAQKMTNEVKSLLPFKSKYSLRKKSQ